MKRIFSEAKCSEPIANNMTILAKDHKQPTRGRPVVSATDSEGTTLSRILAELLKPLLLKVKAHVSDTSQFINFLTSTSVNSDCCFGSLDVVNLYGSIPLNGLNNVYDVFGNFFDTHKDSTLLKDFSKESLIKLIKLATQSDRINIKNSIYSQQKGLAMGNNLSPMLAIVFMDYIENIILNKSENNVMFWKRYIDDIFIISKIPINQILHIANSVNDKIKFTHEDPINEKLPFLDTLISRTFINDLSIFKTDLYIKPLHSGHLLPWSSHVPLSRKVAIMKSERIRAIRNTSGGDVNAALTKISKTFASNGYPNGFIKRYIFNIHNNSNNLQHDNTNINNNNTANKIMYLRVPFINQRFVHKVYRAINNCRLPIKIRPIFTTSKPLSSQLKKVDKTNCPISCICNNKSHCFSKNLVYNVKCKICNQNYIGETHRTFLSRGKEHLSTLHNSKVYEHFKLKHNITIPTSNMVETRILKNGFRDTLQRLAYEEQQIHKHKPLINIQHTTNR